MSIQTHSGLPARCPKTIEAAKADYDAFMKGIAHLKDCDDYNLLYIPKLEDFLRFDVKNSCHPMHHELQKQKGAREYDEDDLQYKKAQFNNGAITEEEYEMTIQEKRVREMTRRAVFDKTDAFKKQLQFEIDVLEQMRVIKDNMDLKTSRHSTPIDEDVGEQVCEGADLYDSLPSD